MRKEINCLDIFSGIGGISFGFKNAGINIFASIDNDKSCHEMSLFNFNKSKHYNKNITELNDIFFEKNFKGKINIVAGGPPCQGFSLIGLRDPEDPRSKLIFEFRRIVNIIKPDYFVFENVPGILSADKGKYIAELIQLFDKGGYLVSEPRILNALQFGAPQDRKRVFLLGTRKDRKKILTHPEPEYCSPRNKIMGQTGFDGISLQISPTVWDAIHDLPEIDNYETLIEGHKINYSKEPKSEYAKIMRGIISSRKMGIIPVNWDKTVCTNCRRTVHGDVLTRRFHETPNGKNVEVSRLYKLKWDDVANTLRAGTPRERGAYSSPRPVHPEQPRVISVREGARLQGFPDWFQFHHTKWHGFRQVGNSVSPFVSYAIGKKIVECYSDELC